MEREYERQVCESLAAAKTLVEDLARQQTPTVAKIEEARQILQNLSASTKLFEAEARASVNEPTRKALRDKIRASGACSPLATHSAFPALTTLSASLCAGVSC